MKGEKKHVLGVLAIGHGIGHGQNRNHAESPISLLENRRFQPKSHRNLPVRVLGSYSARQIPACFTMLNHSDTQPLRKNMFFPTRIITTLNMTVMTVGRPSG